MPHYEVTKRLETVREAVKPSKVTLREMAKHFGLSRYETVRAWELGEVIPSEAKHRPRFITYLLDKLVLRSEPDSFFDLWNFVMVGAWGWKTLEKEDLSLFPEIANLLEPALASATFIPPLPPYEIVGRDDEISKLKELLFTRSNIALFGKPGVGKTALILKLVHSKEILSYFRDGILWASLGQTPDDNPRTKGWGRTTEEVVLAELGKWAMALGITTDEIAKLTTIEERMDAIRITIGRRRMLFVIDDAWQAKAATSLKVGGPNCTYLLTTRIPSVALDFAHESAIEIPELSKENGVKLLKTQARYIDEDNEESLEELAGAVGHLPLALILMGNYLRREGFSRQTHRIQRALEQLDSFEARLHLAEVQSLDHHHPSLAIDVPISLKAVIEISDQALDSASRRALRSLAVFPPKPNTFSEHAAIEVSNKSPDVIGALCDAGLLEISRPNRYTLHQTIADYAKSYSIDGTVDTSAHERLVGYFVSYIKQHERSYEAITTEFENIALSLQTAREKEMNSLFIQGIDALYHYLEIRGLYGFAETQLRYAENIDKDLIQPEITVSIWHNLGRVMAKQGDDKAAASYYGQAFGLVKELGLRNVTVCALIESMGGLAYRQNDSTKAGDYFQQALVLAQELNLPLRMSNLLGNLGALSEQKGEYEQAEKYYHDALAIAETEGDIDILTFLLKNLGVLAGIRGQYDLERKYYERALELADRVTYRERICQILLNLGALESDLNNYEEAEAAYQKGLELANEFGYRKLSAQLQLNLGVLVENQGGFDKAHLYYQQALVIARDRRLVSVECAALLEQGELYVKQEKWTVAQDVLTEALGKAESLQILGDVAYCKYALAKVKKGQGNIDEAYRLGQESYEIFKTTGYIKAEEVKKWLGTLSEN